MEPFKLDPKNVEIIEGEQPSEVPEEPVADENTTSFPTMVNPQEVLNNVKSSINIPQTSQTQRITPPQTAPAQRHAPTPIPMAVPESLH